MIVAVCVLITAILVVDQFCKFLILKYVGLNTTYVIIRGIFSITPTLNTGGGFGILPDQTLLFILISLLTIIFIIYILIKGTTLRTGGDTLQHKKGNVYFRTFLCSRVSPHATYSVSMILAGALGNLIDRLRLGAVIDFIDFKVWPVFNIADSSITIGVIILAWHILFKKGRPTLGHSTSTKN